MTRVLGRLFLIYGSVILTSIGFGHLLFPLEILETMRTVRVGLVSYIVWFSSNNYTQLSLPIPKQHGCRMEITVNPSNTVWWEKYELGVRYLILALSLTAWGILISLT